MEKQPIKIIFWGTPYFSAKILEALIKADFSPILTITAQDKPQGRGLEKQASEAKRMAINHGLNVSQPQKLKEIGFLEQIKALEPDLFIVASYGKIIPKKALEIPKLGCLNIHPSLLPCYRGASPIQATILNGEQETGVTIMLMDEEMDHGPIISNFQFPISKEITFKELEERLIKESSKLLLETLTKWINGEIKPMPQNHSQATSCKIIKKEIPALSRQTTLEQRASDEHLKTPSEHKMETGWERQRKQLQEQKKQISDTVAAQAAKFEELLSRKQRTGTERFTINHIREKLIDSDNLIEYMIIGEILAKPKARRRFI